MCLFYSLQNNAIETTNVGGANYDPGPVLPLDGPDFSQLVLDLIISMVTIIIGVWAVFARGGGEPFAQKSIASCPNPQ